MCIILCINYNLRKKKEQGKDEMCLIVWPLPDTPIPYTSVTLI